MDRSAFEQIVAEGSARIPVAFRGYLREIALVVEREPTKAHQRSAGLASGEELFGLYEGTPRTERAYLTYRLPDKITLFQGPIERACGGDPEAIKEEIARTVWHELAHALGILEERIEQLEADRGWA